MRDRDERESVSGAMHGAGEGAGSPDMPYPRTDAEDSGIGDGAIEGRGSARSGAPRGDQEMRDADAAPGTPARSSRAAEDPLEEGRDADARGRDRAHGGWGDEGIAGGRAGGTGL